MGGSGSKPSRNETINNDPLKNDSLNVKKLRNLELRDLDIAKFLSICIEPKTAEQWESVLLNFWKKFDNVSKHGYVLRFDVACLFLLHYVYYNLDVSVSAISRSLFAYQNRNILLDDRATSLSDTRKYILSEQLRSFTNMYSYRKCEEILVDLTLNSIVDGNQGLAHFLVKFGLVKFPYEDKGKCVKISKTYLMRGLNGFPDSVKRAIHLNELVNQMNASDINFRSVLILFYVVIFAEYNILEKSGMLEGYIEKMHYSNLLCLDLFTRSFNETDINFRDIETFIERFLKPLLSEEDCGSFSETVWILYQERNEFYNPRSLKSLARCTVRQCLQRHIPLPAQVNQLKIPESLKKFLLFHHEDIWKYFKRHLLYYKLQETDISDLLAIMYLHEPQI